jgi:hypothetical protein
MEGSFHCQVTAIVTWMEAIKMGEWEMVNEELLAVLPPILESLRSFELIQVFAGLEYLVKRDPCNIEKLRAVGIINAIKELVTSSLDTETTKCALAFCNTLGIREEMS